MYLHDLVIDFMRTQFFLLLQSKYLSYIGLEILNCLACSQTIQNYLRRL